MLTRQTFNLLPNNKCVSASFYLLLINSSSSPKVSKQHYLLFLGLFYIQSIYQITKHCSTWFLSLYMWSVYWRPLRADELQNTYSVGPHVPPECATVPTPHPYPSSPTLASPLYLHTLGSTWFFSSSKLGQTNTQNFIIKKIILYK